MLEGSSGSVTIAERGDMVGVPRHPNFRLLAAMNPATDAGKRDLPAPLRNRFTEVSFQTAVLTYFAQNLKVFGCVRATFVAQDLSLLCH